MNETAILQSTPDEADNESLCDREAILERTMGRLVRLARRMLHAYPHLRRWEETDDVFQEAAMRLCRTVRDVKIRSTSEFFGLAALQVRRTLIDLARHHFGPQGAAAHYRSDPAAPGGSRFFGAGEIADLSGEPQSLAEWTAFHESVEGLPREDREMFQLVWYGGATYAEAAELVGITRRTAIRRMNRARLLLEHAVVGPTK